MRRKLTARQAEWLQKLCEMTRDKCYPPSLREWMRAMGTKSTNGVSEVRGILARKGWVRTSGAEEWGNVGAKARSHVPLFWPDGSEFGRGQVAFDWPGELTTDGGVRLRLVREFLC